MAQLEPVIPKSPMEEPSSLRQHSPDLNVRPPQQLVPVEEKEATVHDFLSLGGSRSATSSADVAQNGSQSSVTTHDLLQPLQKTAGSSNVLPAVVILGSSKSQLSSVDYNTGQQQPAYNLVNGGVEMQPNYKTSDISHVPKVHGPQGFSSNKNWQQQQKQKKRVTWVVSEEDDDEDDECLDHDYNSKKEIGFQKFDNAQQTEGRNMDSKGLTPRSKHSATEQRRRSKINSRFQMLRQLLPNSDQKRDKASFLLEAIEHIQMLHEKVKKYEAAEHLGQFHERPKALPWDRTSGCKEGVIDVSCAPALMYNIKDMTDANGYMGYQSSPLRVGHGNGNNQTELMASRGHAFPFANRLLQTPTCPMSYENNSLLSNPTLITFATPSSVYGEEPATPTLFPSNSKLLPEARTMFAQLVYQEQAANRFKRPQSKEEVITSTDLHQAGKSMLVQNASFLPDMDSEKRRSPEHRAPFHSDRRANEQVDEQLRSSPVKDMHQRNIISTSKEYENDKGRTSNGVNSAPVDANVKGPKGDFRGEVLTPDQAPPVLGGTLNISSPYSQGLLDSLTQALQRSGVDLSQASISVKIDLGKRSDPALTSFTEIATLNTSVPPSATKEIGHLQELERPTKRPKSEVHL